MINLGLLGDALEQQQQQQQQQQHMAAHPEATADLAAGGWAQALEVQLPVMLQKGEPWVSYLPDDFNFDSVRTSTFWCGQGYMVGFYGQMYAD
ncbi:hypothetical protein OEZ86_012901 [Tetradesmus obliquus]|nr:hypothetical protein OEZ86_012901 [Tetradesmus obliquus]